ncbi:putative indole-3-pyruvate monooxygenase YUCCA10 [Vitis vinifera]|uniref:Flavin-containing monooxygenase n=1 Tax=Vitis vinifera TaxID=29760 RepID=A0A438KID9_VITVI|nr:putative indole-3-pyruvate monooxygenase YUCCA10 [Vitis vinifera]
MQETVVIVVGAGPSGLATAASLNLLSIPNIVLEREDCFAPLWQKKSYDRLHLHLPKQACELAHMPMPTSYPTYPPDFSSYITEKWKVKVRVINGGSDEIEEYSCRFLVVASGETSDAFIPEVEGLSSFKGEVLHSTQYKCGKEYAEKTVLVVGSGNSGMEIALDLSNYGAKTSIVVRSPVHILSKEIMHLGLFLARYLPFNMVEYLTVMLSKIMYGDLTKYGIIRHEEGPFTVKAKYGKYPIIDLGTYKKIKSGEIQVLPALTSIRGSEVVFKNGESHPFDVIVFATGFKRSTNKWLKDDDLLDDNGFARLMPPNNWKGKKGLYCAGLAGRGLTGARVDAEKIANDIKTLLLQAVAVVQLWLQREASG